MYRSSCSRRSTGSMRRRNRVAYYCRMRPGLSFPWWYCTGCGGRWSRFLRGDVMTGARRRPRNGGDLEHRQGGAQRFGGKETVVQRLILRDDTMDVEVFRMSDGVGLELLQRFIICQ